MNLALLSILATCVVFIHGECQVGDTTSPSFNVEDVVIPFFSSTNENPPSYGAVPIVTDESTPIIFKSSDTLLSKAGDRPNTTGACFDILLSFVRVWTATDACGNSASKRQTVRIQSPPSTLTSQVPSVNGAFGFTPDVTQLENACFPGKLVYLGEKTYIPEGPSERCANIGWKIDGCRVSSRINDVIFEILPQRAVFATVPSASVTVSVSDSIDPSSTGIPTADNCGAPSDILYEDSDPTPIAGDVCGWTIIRTWYIRPQFQDCLSGPKTSVLTTTYVQTITIIDNVAPVFASNTPTAITVPFFQNYDVEFSPVPLVEEKPADVGLGLGLASTPVTLQSVDSILSLASITSNAATCRTDGLASFTRTFTVSDTCNNTATHSQLITIEHPPETITSAGPEVEKLHDYLIATDVYQVFDGCLPGKTLRLGMKSYDQNPANNLCLSASSNTVCGLARAVDTTQTSIYPVKPVFTSFPDDIEITISVDKDNFDNTNGQPTAEALCDTPFEMFHTDSDPVRIEGGKCGWTITRVWTIRPVFADCPNGVPVDSMLTTQRNQIITIIDDVAPFFDQKLATVVIPFFINYNESQSPIPVVYEKSTIPLYNQLGLASTPLTLTSTDTELKTATTASPEATCAEDGLASFKRTFHVTDSCGNSDSFEQLVTIQHPPSSPTSLVSQVNKLDAYLLSVDVAQLFGCMPGKHVLLGTKAYQSQTSNLQCLTDSLDTTCGLQRTSTYADENIYAVKPEFDTFPSDATVTIDSDVELNTTGIPTGKSLCGTPLEITHTDSEPVQQDSCSWQIIRSWTIRPVYSDCPAGVPLNSPLATTRTQTITIVDNQAPYFSEEVKAIRIPFFESYTSSSPIPTVYESSANPKFNALSLFSTPISLSSTDTQFRVATPQSPNETCVSDGLSSFLRTWNTSDSCGNTRSFDQLVTIEHPPAALTDTQVFHIGNYATANDLTQIEDYCEPGKGVLLGTKLYKPLLPLDQCMEVPWSDDGCRTTSRAENILYRVSAVKPIFSSFPADINITTAESHMPANTGTPTPFSVCNSPHTMNYSDSEPTLIECGVWQVTRTWVVRAVYKECDGMVGPDLTTIQSQIITINDVFPPNFDAFEDSHDVNFLDDYGPSALSLPTIYDPIDDEGLQTLDVNSYPIRLQYEDNVTFYDSPTEICATQNLVMIERTWTASDACGTSQSKVQRIRIRKSDVGLWGDNSRFQVSSFGTYGKGYVKNSNISMSLSSARSVEFKYGSKVGDEACQSSLDDNEYSVVLGTCPYKVYDLSINTGSVAVLDSENLVTTFARSGLPTAFDQDLENETGCKVPELLNSVSNGNVNLIPSVQEFPLDFTTELSKAKSASEKLKLSPNLLTGPKVQECYRNGDCVTLVDSASTVQQHSFDSQNDILHLTGMHQVYNMFNVKLAEYLHIGSLENGQTPQLAIDAPGFVLLNVLDEVDVDPNGKYTYRSVFPKKGTCGHAWEIGHDSKYTEAHMRSVLNTGANNQDLSSHFLVNIVHELFGSDAESCAAMKLKIDNSKVGQTLVGTLLLTNPYSHIELKNTRWNGGQIVAGDKVDLTNTFLGCDLFAANAICPRE
eukprot:m.28772 g.28772  ORF g.28772 m.28772 type:complete len:1586 (+) comp8034_c1_seq1:217-4974(+)